MWRLDINKGVRITYTQQTGVVFLQIKKSVATVGEFWVNEKVRTNLLCNYGLIDSEESRQLTRHNPPFFLTAIIHRSKKTGSLSASQICRPILDSMTHLQRVR